RVATVRSADRDRDVLRALRRSVRIPLAENAKPPDEVAPAVASRGTGVGSNRQVDAPSGSQQLIRDLHPGRSGPDDEDRTVGQLIWVAIATRVHLHRPGIGRNDRRDQWTLK